MSRTVRQIAVQDVIVRMSQERRAARRAAARRADSMRRVRSQMSHESLAVALQQLQAVQPVPTRGHDVPEWLQAAILSEREDRARDYAAN